MSVFYDIGSVSGWPWVIYKQNICEETTERQLFIDLITHIITPVHGDVLFSCKLPWIGLETRVGLEMIHLSSG